MTRAGRRSFCCTLSLLAALAAAPRASLAQSCNGMGSTVHTFVDYYLYDVAVADFNGDGKPDVATVSFFNQAVYIRLGQGNGTFTGTTSYLPGAYPSRVAVGDFNGDGRKDVAVLSAYPGRLSVLLGQGDGTFTV